MRKRLLGLHSIFQICALVIIGACSSTRDYPKGSIVVEGEMYYANLEGGCWVFRANDGQTYELFGENISELRREGRKAVVRILPRSDVASICMVGRIAQLIEIVRIVH
jgi:hypothetical protein